ncbi:alpha/beta hydrolase fold precursor [Nonlabens ulvanivorans]|uniref:Alpha/beta hydrolase fold n=1 Tax=Nonlabens ulvanivorans TaxID=906888 RepID=A0A090WC43_NONUL|nr:alpha/beta hydrolase [Nonlabens ulvanivorans]GAL74575.1 alpha/beta hydrolase fold precursor [Nonlabens ulvanivorans]
MKKLITFKVLFVLLLVGCEQKIEDKTKNKSNNVAMAETQNTKTKLPTTYKSLEVDGVNIAYREAGNPKNPTIVLLHGFPASSHQYRKVLNQLSDEYHLVAPDYPGFGNSDFPSTKDYEYTFDNIANTIDVFLEKKGLKSFAIMIQDYGAPVGFRIATKYPERITAIINQNGNAYEQGLGPGWKDIKKFWVNRTKEAEAAIIPAFSLEGLKWQYSHGTRNPETVNPDTWHLDFLRLSRPNAHAMNIDLLFDYQNNVKKYPEWQQYLRDNQPPLLIVWGKNDVYFPESGAEAFKKDVKNIDYNIYDTGHFALEEDGDDIINKMRLFMKKTIN